MNKHTRLTEFIKAHPDKIGKVVDYNPTVDRLLPFDFTAANTELSPDDVNDTEKFSRWVNKKLAENKPGMASAAIWNTEPFTPEANYLIPVIRRRLHLGIDIWANAGTPVYVPISGHIHSFQDNDHFGDYGPTIILKHQLDELELYSLYGHLSRKDLIGLKVGSLIEKGRQLASFGTAEENGHWPPHLHFQLMFDIGDSYGDYPGVARYSEKDKWLENVPDPNFILRFP